MHDAERADPDMNDSVIADYLDGVMPSADDEAAVLDRLASDPALAADCEAQAMIHALLPMALNDSTAAAVMAKRVVAHLSRPADRPAEKPVRRQPWVVAILTAAAVLLVGLLLIPHSKPIERPWSLATSRLDLNLPDSAAQLRLVAGTRYRLGGASGPDVEIATGGIEVAIARHLSTPFIIVTPGATATVLGTAFRVQADAVGTSLEVQRGRVRLTGHSGQPVEVGPGQGSQCSVDGAAAVPQRLPPSAPILDQILPDGDLPLWRTDAVGGSRITLSETGAGGIAAKILRSGVDEDWTWFGCSTACAQDWRGATGMSFEVQADGAGLVVEVGGYRPDLGGQYYFSSAPISGLRATWQTVHIPFSAFVRYPGHAADVSGPVAPILGQIAHVGFFPGVCSHVAVRGLRLWHQPP